MTKAGDAHAPGRGDGSEGGRPPRVKAVVRPMEKADIAGVNKLRTLVYPHHPEAHYHDWHEASWAWLANHPAAPEHLHRWVVAEGDKIVGHLAATPQYYRINGQRVLAHTPADYQILPRYGFQAVSLMRRFFRTVENCVACDMVPTVISVETRLGAEEAGELDYAAKLLNVSRLPVPRLPAPLRKLLNIRDEYETARARGYEGQIEADPLDDDVPPPPVRARLPVPGPAERLLNGALGGADLALGGAFARGHVVEEVNEFDDSFDDLFEEVAARVPCTAERDAAFLRWRYGPGSPSDPVTVLGVRGSGGRILGYAALKVAAASKGQDGYVMDLTVRPGRPDVARALLRGAIGFFRREGAQIIRYRYQDSPVSPRPSDLWRLGFFHRKGRSNHLLVKFSDPGLHETARDVHNWSYTTGDGEATFWML